MYAAVTLLTTEMIIKLKKSNSPNPNKVFVKADSGTLMAFWPGEASLGQLTISMTKTFGTDMPKTYVSFWKTTCDSPKCESIPLNQHLKMTRFRTDVGLHVSNHGPQPLDYFCLVSAFQSIYLYHYGSYDIRVLTASPKILYSSERNVSYLFWC